MKGLFIIYLLFLFLVQIKTEEKTQLADLDISITEDKFISFYMFLGSEEEKFRSIISTGTDLTWVSDVDSSESSFDDLYNKSASTSYEKKEEYSEIIPEYSFKSGNLATDKFKYGYYYKEYKKNETFHNATFETYKFGLARSSKYNNLNKPDVDAVIGMGQNSEFIKRIKEIIDNKNVFSIEMDDNKTGHLYYGNYSEIFLQQRSKTGFCFNREKGSYNCRLSHIIFGNNTESDYLKNKKEIYEKAYFHTGINEFIFPQKYTEDFKNNLKQCRFENDYFYCVNMDNIISLVFNGYAIKISKENAYETAKSGEYKLKIKFSGEKFLIGSIFFIEYKVLFDYDKGVNIFYNQNEDKIGNVKYYTDDKDIIFKEFIPQFAIGAGLGLLFIGYTIFICIMKRSKINKEK